MAEEMICRKHRLSSFQIIILGFAGVILLGTLLLMLPPFNEALFTATSAVCVTGLVVQDTGSYWSVFGQAVILTLIQIGGLGVVTVAASFVLLSKRKFSLMQRSTMQDAISAPKVGGIVQLTRFILQGTVLIELLGALAMLPVFCRDYGWQGICTFFCFQFTRCIFDHIVNCMHTCLQIQIRFFGLLRISGIINHVCNSLLNRPNRSDCHIIFPASYMPLQSFSQPYGSPPEPPSVSEHPAYRAHSPRGESGRCYSQHAVPH